MKNILFIIFIVPCVVKCFSGKEGVSYKFQRTSCKKFNKKFVYNMTCRVRHLNRTTQIQNWEMYIQPNVSVSNIRFKTTSYYKYGTVFRPSLINYSEFICEALNNGTFSHYFSAYRASYSKYSNLLEPCPKSGRLYIKDMIVDTSKFPQFMPIGEYRIDIEIFTHMNGKEEFVFMNQDYIEVKALGALQF